MSDPGDRGRRGLGPRDVAAATGRTYDLIVVGGGVHGLCATLHAVRAGVRVLLIDRDDFASQTSANSLQILHGGFRYLQSLDWQRLRESARARAWWMGQFPDLTAPLECVLPLDGRGVRRPEIFRAALALHHRLSRERPSLPEGRVERAHWQLLDRAQDALPVITPLADHVEALRWRFMDAAGEWQEFWPPASDAPRAGASAVPRGVEVTLVLDDDTEIVRVFALEG